MPKRTTSRTASAQQILQAIKQQQKSTTLTSITATSTTLPSGIISSTANIELRKIVDTNASQQPPSQSKQVVGFCQQATGLGVSNQSGKNIRLIFEIIGYKNGSITIGLTLYCKISGHQASHTVPTTRLHHPAEVPRSALSESALQWSSESTLEASEIVRRKHAKSQRAIHHHHYFYHHHPQKEDIRKELSDRRGYRNGHQRSLSGGSAGQSTRTPIEETYGRGSAIQNGFHSKDDMMLHQRKTQTQFQGDGLSDTEETAGDVCLECSEWLGRALLCSCQVPSSSSANSSPSQTANATAAPAPAGLQPEVRAKSSSGSIEQRSSSRHSSAERSDRIYGSSHAHATVESNGNGFARPHQQTITAEINVAPQQRGVQGHSHQHSGPHQQHHHHHPQRTQRVQYQQP